MAQRRKRSKSHGPAAPAASAAVSSNSSDQNAPTPPEGAAPARAPDAVEGPPATPTNAAGKAKPTLSRTTSISRHDPIAAYVADLAKYDVLPSEEQIRLAIQYKEKGDLGAAFKLVTSNLRLVVKIAHEYRRTSLSVLDLIQEGNIGLMQAVKKFDPYRGVKLSSYAAWWIRAYIIRYVMENWRLVRIGTTRVQRRLFFNLRKEKEKLAAMGFDPAPKLLAERLQVSEEDIIDMDKRMGAEEVSIDAPSSADGEGPTLGDRLSGANAPTDERLAQDELRSMLRTKLEQFGATLVDREKLIFERRLIAEKPMTLQEIGDQYGISRERARQVEVSLTRRLKAFLEEQLPDLKDITLGPTSD